MGQTPQRLNDFGRKPFGRQLLQRPVAVLDHIVQHPDDLLFGGFARGHDPQRVADIVISGLVALAAVRLGGNLDGSFQGTHALLRFMDGIRRVLSKTKIRNLPTGGKQVDPPAAINHNDTHRPTDALPQKSATVGGFPI